MSISCRPATPRDLPVLNRFQRDIIRTEAPYIKGRKHDDYSYYDLGALLESPHAEMVVAEIDNTVVGSGYVQQRASRHYYRNPHHGYVGFMYTLPAYRGRGVARAVLASLGRWAKEHGMDELRLEVFSENNTAISAYAAAGFEATMLTMRRAI
ncbi:GNAT family N-acetyltransferase [Alteromonas sp. ASW11-19]|uniref:GNAT family N-acetyltransferase n=1 Tax=Alteromonas salexigens TaxID=2982530 RepID=A0ABT2VJW8_9ALTE|nr:GNAT family N-acetyltransferase [Alteromonas salexigens]MCU7553552.1 GNAT family N-acetyltransferase [Alteromonas salexigens]